MRFATQSLSALAQANEVLHSWRLDDCELYVTLEPCPMCAGAVVNSRIKRVICGARDPKAGAFGSLINLNAYPLNHKPELSECDLGGSCGEVLVEFFKAKR